MIKYQYDKLKDFSFLNYLRLCANIYRPPNGKHGHDYFEIEFPVKNSCVNVINGREIEFSVGVCCLLRPSDTHFFKKIPKCPFGEYVHKDVYVSVEKMQRICNAISPDLYDKIISAEKPISFKIPSSALRLLIRQSNLVQSLDREKANEAEALHSTLVTTILSCYMEDNLYPSNNTQMPDWLKNILKKLSSIEYMIMPIKDLAKEVGYAPEHVSREFHKYMGVSINKYVTKKKMEYASAILMQNDVKIIDLAQMLGYSNPSNFSKNFFNEFQIMPNKYSEKVRNANEQKSSVTASEA